jgi:hypothetical protein
MITPQEPQSPAGIPPISENPSMNPPVPDSPADPTSVQPELSQDEMKGNLKAMMDKIQAKKQELDTSMFDVNKISQESKSQLFSEVYDFFQKNGIDPTNPDQVKTFLAKLQQTQPDVYKEVVQILNMIMADDSQQPQPSDTAGAPVAEPSADAVPTNNMNINPNETPTPSI